MRKFNLSFKICVFLLAIQFVLLPAQAAEPSRGEIKTVTLRILKNSNGWVRILSTGATIALTTSDAYALGLSPTDSVGKIVSVVAIDTANDAVELGSDLATLGRFVAVDVAMPMISSSYEYTGDMIIPKAAEWSKNSYDYTKDTIIPKAGEVLSSGAESVSSGIKSVWKWATD